jgi:hypothetical protein
MRHRINEFFQQHNPVFCWKYLYWDTVVKNVVCNKHYPRLANSEREVMTNTQISWVLKVIGRSIMWSSIKPTLLWLNGFHLGRSGQADRYLPRRCCSPYCKNLNISMDIRINLLLKNDLAVSLTVFLCTKRLLPNCWNYQRLAGYLTMPLNTWIPLPQSSCLLMFLHEQQLKGV